MTSSKLVFNQLSRQIISGCIENESLLLVSYWYQVCKVSHVFDPIILFQLYLGPRTRI